MSKASQIRQKAISYVQKGRFDAAITEYKRLISVESRNPNLFNELGDIFLKSGDRIQAVNNFEKAIVNYEEVALYNNAVAVCKKILRIVPDRIDTIYKLGELRAKQKFTGEAVKYFIQYIESAEGDGGGPLDELQKKMNAMLTLVQDSEHLLSRGVELFDKMGMKSKSAELLAKLYAASNESGDSDKAAGYERELESRKSALTPDEWARIDKTVNGGLSTGDAKDSAVKDEAVKTGDAEPEEFEESIEQENACDLPREAEENREAPEGETADESGSRIESIVDETVEKTGLGAADEEEPWQEEAAGDDDGPVEEDERGARPEGNTETGQQAGRDEGVSEWSASPSGAPSDGDSVVESLAKEITSDVEEDDYKSHYDLGMAYLEMALYTDATKEFQIATRSEKLQLKSIEMIGHCFILQNNPRLAVKQLSRGLEIARSMGAESLGIHYNLAIAYEMMEDLEKAREHFEEVYIVDVTFRDVAEKMKKLSAIL